MSIIGTPFWFLMKKKKCESRGQPESSMRSSGAWSPKEKKETAWFGEYVGPRESIMIF